MTEEIKENNSEEFDFTINKNEKKVTLAMMDKEYSLEFSTEEDAAKASALCEVVMRTIQGLVNMGATFVQKEIDVPEETEEPQDM